MKMPSQVLCSSRSVRLNSLGLQTWRFGASAGYGYAPVFTQAVSNKIFAGYEEVFQAAPELANLRKLLLLRTDVFICEINVCQYFIASNAPEFADLDFVDTAIGDVRTYHLAISKAWPGRRS